MHEHWEHENHYGRLYEWRRAFVLSFHVEAENNPNFESGSRLLSKMKIFQKYRATWCHNKVRVVYSIQPLKSIYWRQVVHKFWTVQCMLWIFTAEALSISLTQWRKSMEAGEKYNLMPFSTDWSNPGNKFSEWKTIFRHTCHSTPVGVGRFLRSSLLHFVLVFRSADVPLPVRQIAQQKSSNFNLHLNQVSHDYLISSL